MAVGRFCCLFVEIYQTINHPTGLKELESVMRWDCDDDCLDDAFGACGYHERTCSLLGIF